MDKDALFNMVRDALLNMDRDALFSCRDFSFYNLGVRSFVTGLKYSF